MSEYRGWDTHAYTTLWTAEAERLGFKTPVPVLEWKQLLRDLDAAYPGAVALRKFAVNFSAATGGYMDAQLGGLNVARLLLEVWALVRRAQDGSVTAGFGEILADIGNTCVQGDSHRLLAYYVALHRSGTEIKTDTLP